MRIIILPTFAQVKIGDEQAAPRSNKEEEKKSRRKEEEEKSGKNVAKVLRLAEEKGRKACGVVNYEAWKPGRFPCSIPEAWRLAES